MIARAIPPLPLAALGAALALCACANGAGPGGEALGDGRAPQTLQACASPDGGSAATDGGCAAACTGLSPSQGWNAQGLDLGAAQAVLEEPELQVLFGAQGATVLAGGVVVSTDASITAWRGAALLPATDGRGTWAVGIDATGKLHRVTGAGALEPVSDRFGLGADAVQAAVALGGAWAAFALDGVLAVSDGVQLVRHAASPLGLTGAAGRAAWIEGDKVRRYDPAADRLEGWTLPGVKRLAVTAGGRLLAATDDALYGEAQTLNLNLLYRSGGPRIVALAASGERGWFSVEGRLAAVEGTAVQRTAAAVVAPDAALAPALGGGVWALGAAGPRRFAAGGGELAAWQQSVLPVFARVCSACHLPGGSSGIPLASFEQWQEKRALIGQRVVQGLPKPMPPEGAATTLTPAEKELVRCWVGAAG